MIQLRGPEQPPPAGGKPHSLVVLLHGFGADGNDLIGLAPHWANALPRSRFAAPDAPEPCAMAPTGRQWFALGDYTEESLHAGAARAAPLVDSYLDRLLAAHGLTDDRLALAGFSQGTMMALQVALRRRRAPACVLGYSGRLVAGERLRREATARVPVMLIHGDADSMIAVDAMFAAAAALGAANIAAQWHVCRGVGHAIAPEGLAIGGRFLRDHLA